MADTTRRGGRAGSGRPAGSDKGRIGPSPDDHPGGGADTAPSGPSAAPMCSVAFCPICTMVTALGEARPELVEHLLLAGREMLLAARAVIDARLESMDREEKGTRLERISIE